MYETQHNLYYGKSNPNYKHGFTKHPLYAVWTVMMQRCYNPNNKDYPYYGERGIIVFAAWHEAEIFCVDIIELGWKVGLSIDRIDNNGNYEPKNIKLSNRSEQTLNSRLIRSNNQSGFRGVSCNSWSYTSYITVNNVRHHLGSYATAYEAALVRDIFVQKNQLHTPLNIPLGSLENSEYALKQYRNYGAKR